MKLQKIIRVGGKFAKPNEDFRDGDVIKILNEGTIVEGTFGEQHVFKIACKTGENNLAFNQTSLNNIIDAYGDDTVGWIGKEVKVFMVKQMIQGKLKNVCYLAGKDAIMNDDGTFIAGPTSDEINSENIPF